MLTAIAFILFAAAVGSTPTNVVEASASTNTAVRTRAMRPRTPIQEAEPVSATVVDASPVEPASPSTVVVPDVVAVELAKMTVATVPEVLAAAIAKATEAEAPAIAAAVYAKLVELLVPETLPAELVKIKREWFEKFSAVPASKAWWILQLAKDKASRGESVEDLRKLFEDTMAEWLKEDD